MICVVETTPGHRLAAAQYDPPTASERLAWHVGRTLEWLVAASRDELVRVGDPFELPYYWPTRYPETFVAFHEGRDTFAAWNRVQARAGHVELASVNERPRQLLAAVAFHAADGHELVRPRWGERISAATSREMGVWLRLDEVPRLEPWKAPETFADLRAIAASQGVAFDRSLEPVLERIRDGTRHVLLLGFPIPERRGQAPSLIHWLGVRLEPLAATDRVGRFRADGARRLRGRQSGPLADAAPIPWLDSGNWHPSQLGSRGHFVKGLRDRTVVVLGSGALGSAIAELLVRGGIERIVVIDDEWLEAGNLVRHTLGIDDIGWPKSMQLANRLNAVSPNASAFGVLGAFPALDADGLRLVRSAGLIIDTTGDDEVVRAIGSFDWGPGPREFASASFSYGAERLYSYVTSIASFDPAAFFAEARPWIEHDKRLTEDMVWEGAGCRYPVFPARADDVMALAALAVRDLDERLLNHGPRGLRVFEREGDGTIRQVVDPSGGE